MTVTRKPTVVSVWPRCKAQAIDTVVVVGVTAVLTLITTGSGLEEPWRPAVWAAMAAVGLLYFTVCEWRGGQTLGKKLCDIEVRAEAGGRLGLPQAFVRNVLRAVDGLGLYLVGAVFVWTSPQRQRLGDRAAGSIVVRSRPDAPDLRSDGTHPHGQPEADDFNVAVQSEIGRPPPR